MSHLGMEFLGGFRVTQALLVEEWLGGILRDLRFVHNFCENLLKQSLKRRLGVDIC